MKYLEDLKTKHANTQLKTGSNIPGDLYGKTVREEPATMEQAIIRHLEELLYGTTTTPRHVGLHGILRNVSVD